MENINNFNGGMVRDHTTSLNQSNSYYDALDLRPYGETPMISGAMSTFKGTIGKYSLPDRDTFLVGSVVIDHEIVVFTVNQSTSVSSIYLLNEVDETFELIFSDENSVSKLNFNYDNKIHGTSKFESEFSKKAYWTDGVNPVRYINVYKDYTDKEASSLDITPNYNIGSTIAATHLVGGNINTGNVQYFIRYFNKYDNNTGIAGSSNMISLTKDNSEGRSFGGHDIGESSNSSVKLDIDHNGNELLFDQYSIYRVLYESVTEPPLVNIVSESNVNGLSSMTYIDTGSVIVGELTIEEFNSIYPSNIVPKVIESFKGSLMLANITNAAFDVDVDTRAYSFDGTNTPRSITYGSDNSIYDQLTINEDETWNLTLKNGPDIFGSGFENIPLDFEAINKDCDVYNINDRWGVDYDSEQTAGLRTIQHYELDRRFAPPIDERLSGGTGSIVSYVISNNDYTNDIASTFSGKDASTKEYKLRSNSHKRGEVYRYGIQFFSNKGEISPVKWIADILIPRFRNAKISSATSHYEVSESSSVIRSSASTIDFTVDTRSIPSEIMDEISGFKIVRAERNNGDISCVQAIAYPNDQRVYTNPGSVTLSTVSDTFIPLTHHYDDAVNELEYTVPFGDGTIPANPRSGFGSSLCLFGPDIDVNDWHPSVDDKMIICGHIERPKRFESNGEDDKGICVVNPELRWPSSDLYNSQGNFIAAEYNTLWHTDTVSDASSLSGVNVSKGAISVGSDSISSDSAISGVYYLASENTNAKESYSGINGLSKSVIHGIVSSLMPNEINNDYGFPIIDYIKNNFDSRYGGNTWEARSSNIYISASEYVDCSVSGVYNTNSTGDTHIKMYRKLLSSPMNTGKYVFEETEGDRALDVSRSPFKAHGVIVPMESLINTDLYHEDIDEYFYSLDGSDTTEQPGYDSQDVTSQRMGTFIQEDRASGITMWPTTYPSDISESMIQYNTAYSSVPRYPESFGKNPLVEDIASRPNSIIASNPISNGSIIDSWGVFQFTSELIVDGNYGGITSLQSFKNRLALFQEYAIGYVSSNERLQTQSDNGTSLSLGTGGVLERYDYISTSTGCPSWEYISKGLNKILYLDYNNLEIFDFSSPGVSLSDRKGINSYMNELNINPEWICTSYDTEFKEHLLTFGARTLVYNEVEDIFIGRYQTTPKVSISSNTGLYSFIDFENIGEDRFIFKHNENFMHGATYNEVWTNGLFDPFVQIFLNPNNLDLISPNVIKYRDDVYSNNRESFPNGISRIDKTIKSVNFRNHYSNETVYLKIKESNSLDHNVSNVGGLWRFQVPQTSNGNRLIGPFSLIKFNVDKTEGNLHVIHVISTDYSVHKT